MANLRESWYYKVRSERNDLRNEIHRMLVELNLQMMFFDQELHKLVTRFNERCEENEFLFLKIPIQSLIIDQQNMKQWVSDLAVRSFKHRCTNIGDLQGFALEQEIYRLLLDTAKIEEMQILIIDIQLLTKGVDERNKIQQDLKMKIDGVPTWDLGAAVNGSQISKNGGSFGNREMSASDVVEELYEFPSYEMSKETECLNFLDHQYLSENCGNEEDPMTENLRRLIEKFECMDMDTYD